LYQREANRLAEACRQRGEELRFCTSYLDKREIGAATSDDEGRTWANPKIVVDAKNSGDGTAPGAPGAVLVGEEIWVYYVSSSRSFMKENLFRVRLAEGDLHRLGGPDPVRITGFTPGTSLDNVQLVLLHCEGKDKFVATMVANNRQRNAITFYASTDGLSFKPSAEASIVPPSGHDLAAPTQLPGDASADECRALQTSGVQTRRDLMYAEQLTAATWALRRLDVRLTLP
jgi:hypothetical protein